MTVYWIVLAILDEAGYDPVTRARDDITYATMKRRAHVAQKEKQPRLPKRHAGPPSAAQKPTRKSGR